MLIRSGEVTLRSFEPADTDAVLEVRNHPTVRAGMRDASEISRESHYQWVRENLLEAQRVRIFVVLNGERMVGIALLRNLKGHEAEIGVMIVEAESRPLVCYVAAHLIGYYGFEVLGLEKLHSRVPRHNSHALAFNRSCGFEPSGVQSEAHSDLVLTRARYHAHPTHRRYREKHRIEVIDDSGPASGGVA